MLGQSSGWYSTANANFTYSGTTTVALTSGTSPNGSLIISGPGSLPATSALNLVSGNVLLGENQTVTGLGGSGSALNASGASSTLTINVPSGLSYSYAGTLGNDSAAGSNALSLVIAGGGIETLTGSNTFSGKTTVNGGTLQLGNANAVNQSTVAVNAAGGLSFGGGVATFNVGGLSGSGSFSLANTAGSAVSLSLGGNGQGAAFAGNISGSGSLVKTGSAMQALTGNNSYLGTTVVMPGILEADTTASLPGYNSSGLISVAASATLAVNMGGSGEWQPASVDALEPRRVRIEGLLGHRHQQRHGAGHVFQQHRRHDRPGQAGRGPVDAQWIERLQRRLGGRRRRVGGRFARGLAELHFGGQRFGGGRCDAGGGRGRH